MGEISEALRRAQENADDTPSSPRTARGAAGREADDRDSFPLSLDMVTSDLEDRDEPKDERPEPGAPADPSAPSPSKAATAAAPSPTPTSPGVEPLKLDRSKQGEWRARSVLLDDARVAETYRHFAIRVAREADAKNFRAILLASALQQEGKTTTVCNLALALATLGDSKRIALVDLDLRKPSIANYLQFRADVGIDTVLTGRASLDEARVPIDLGPVDIYPVAKPLADAHSHLVSPRFGQIMRELKQQYDLVLIDSPPVLFVPDVALLAPSIDACILVLRSRQTLRHAFQRMLEIVPQDKILGIFMNDIRSSRLSRYESRSYGRSEYGHDYEEQDEA